MKKTLKKLSISRETLQALASSEVQKAAGASMVRSCLSGCEGAGHCPTTGSGTDETLVC
jgi:hypothetical protein